MKFLNIVMAGAGSAGKTTTTQAFGLGEPKEYRNVFPCELRNGIQDKEVVWTLYDNCGCAGNHASGVDANVGPALVRHAFYQVLQKRRIVIVDGYMSTPRWVEMANDWDAEHPEHELVVLVLHFQLRAEDIITRMSQRRGETYEETEAFIQSRMRGNLRRVELIMEHFERSCELEMYILNIYPEDDTETIVQLMNEYICDIFDVNDVSELENP